MMELNKSQNSNFPLCVDVDGTLIKTDLLFESLLSLLKKNIFFSILLPFWLLKGKAHLKQQIASRVQVDVTVLPYNSQFIKFLIKEHQNGRRLVLSTAANVIYAEQIAQHLALFSDVIASDGSINMIGLNKLEEFRKRFGDKGFDYAGDRKSDLDIWPHAFKAIVVNPTKNILRTVDLKASVDRVFNDKKNIPLNLLRAIRLHQWLKNLLLFVPLITSHNLIDLSLLLNSVIAFFSFSLCASGVYMMNDLLDLESDRHHPKKKYRPFAAGDLSIRVGLFLIPLFFLCGLMLSLSLHQNFSLILGLYILLTMGYSFYLKQIALIDVLLIAALYTIRIVAGALTISVALSHWLLAFSVFIFLSLAMVKRYSEILTLIGNNQKDIKGRGYGAGDLGLLANLGTASGYIAVLVMALYINSQDVLLLYAKPKVLWFIWPLILYWISRVWLFAQRGLMHEDPVIFALKDKVSYVIGFMTALIVIFAALL